MRSPEAGSPTAHRSASLRIGRGAVRRPSHPRGPGPGDARRPAAKADKAGGPVRRRQGGRPRTRPRPSPRRAAPSTATSSASPRTTRRPRWSSSKNGCTGSPRPSAASSPRTPPRLRLALKFSKEELILEQMRETHKLLKDAQLSRAEDRGPRVARQARTPPQRPPGRRPRLPAQDRPAPSDAGDHGNQLDRRSSRRSGASSAGRGSPSTSARPEGEARRRPEARPRRRSPATRRP